MVELVPEEPFRRLARPLEPAGQVKALGGRVVPLYVQDEPHPGREAGDARCYEATSDALRLHLGEDVDGRELDICFREEPEVRETDDAPFL